MNMYEADNMKNSFIHKTYGSFCQACLSLDRKLSPIGQYIDVYNNIINNGNSTGIISESILLCWECMAILRKVKTFQTKVDEAQWILNNGLDKKQICHLNLSNLSITYTDDIIIISHNDKADEIIDQKVIKQEIESDNECDTSFTVDNTNTFLQEIKKENREEKIADKKSYKKRKVRPSRHYVILSNSKKVRRKKFCIEKGMIQDWWERERDSNFYKNFEYKCMLCVHGYDSPEKLQAHILKRHVESIGPYICHICNYRFSSQTSLSTHISIHETAYQCTWCSFKCVTFRRMNAHMDEHDVLQCVYCKAEFQDTASFYAHYKSLHTKYLCDHCNKRCKTKQSIEKHMKHHLPIHKCQICKKTYANLRALRKHRWLKHNSSSPEDRYCVFCDKQFVSIALYRLHIANSSAHIHERNTSKQKIKCPECSNTYSRKTYMMNHYRYVHTNQSKHYCEHCDRHFLNRTRFVEHMKYKHEGVKKDKNKLCNICGRGFAATRTLQNHIRTHSGERPYECEYCSAKFTQRTSMLYHVKYIHLKVKRKPQWQ